MTRSLRNQLHDFINHGETLVNVINYLFTCDYEEDEIIEMLTGRGFNCNREILIDTFVVDFGMDRSKFEN